MSSIKIYRLSRGTKLPKEILNVKFVDSGDKKSQLIVNDSIISIENPIGLYISKKAVLMLKFDPSNPDEKVYISDNDKRSIYTESNYVDSFIVDHHSYNITVEISNMKKYCEEWDSKVKNISYEKSKFVVIYDDKKYTLNESEFFKFLKGERVNLLGKETNLRFKNISIKKIGKSLNVKFEKYPKPWNLGLNSAKTVICIYKYITSRVSRMERVCPIILSRRLTEIVAFTPGNQGIIQGKWLEGKESYSDYTDMYTDPNNWESTPDIINKYLSINNNKIPNPSNHNPRVKYAQCFIFGCLLQSFMRCIGIPCRIVKTDNASHDINRNYIITIEEGREYPVWNFHVWNEVWMSRPDIKGYDEQGWQVVDSTPQGLSYSEKLTSKMSCGPCPVRAIRELSTDIKYDCNFIIAEVNPVLATVIKRNDKWLVYSTLTNTCGTSILIENADKVVPYNATGFPIFTEFKTLYNDPNTNPIKLLTANNAYTSTVDMSGSKINDLNVKVVINNDNPINYNVRAIMSYEYADGPLDPKEINSNNVSVRSFKYTNGVFIYKGSFCVNKYNCKIRDNSSCVSDSKKHSKCANRPTFKVFIDKKRTYTIIDARCSLTVNQWDKSEGWIFRTKF